MFITVKSLTKNETFLRKDLADSIIVCTFALAFEKSRITQSNKERVL